MKKLLSIAVLAFGLSASIAYAQEPKGKTELALYSEVAEQSTAKKSSQAKPLADRIQSIKSNVASAISGDVKDQSTSAKHALHDGKSERKSTTLKQYNPLDNVSSDSKSKDRLRSSPY